ncbi:type II toxin-antitoxin system Phd/YefM family antitoxin [Thermoflexus hugenholtzii]
MPVQVSVRAIKTRLHELLHRVQEGEEIIITRAGKPIARLVPIEEEKPGRRMPGSAKGKIWIREDFDAPLPESIIAEFDQ